MARFVIGVSSDDVDADHCVRMVQLFRWFEFTTVDLEGREKCVGGEVRCERVGQSERCGEFRTEGARAQDPDRNFSAGAGNSTNRLSRNRWREERLQLKNILRE